MFGLGAQELWLILFIVLLLFGATQLPRLMRSIGHGIKEFKSAVKDQDIEGGTSATEPGAKPDKDKDITA